MEGDHSVYKWGCTSGVDQCVQVGVVTVCTNGGGHSVYKWG